MGKHKQNRRKQRGKVKAKNSPIPTASDGATGNKNQNSESTSVIARICHADPKVRQATLLALQSTLLHPNSNGCQNNNNDRVVQLGLLQAVRERVLDDNLDCACAAAECLACYLSKEEQRVAAASPQHAQAAASWVAFLLKRLEDCVRGIVTSTSDPKGQVHKQVTTVKQWHALAVPCVRVICKLIENNAMAMERIQNDTQTQRLFITTHMTLVQLAYQHITKRKRAPSPGDPMETTAANTSALNLKKGEEKSDLDSKSLPKSDDMHEELVKTLAILAARTIHSALDDNADLVELFGEQASKDDLKFLSDILGLPTMDERSSATMQGSKNRFEFPIQAVLHVAGCVVTAVQVRPSDSRWHSCLVQQVLPRLLFVLRQQHSWQSVEADYREALNVWKQERTDDELEQEIISMVHTRKEPAREIARRMKKTPRDEEGKQKSKLNQQQDGRELVESAVAAWTRVIIPFHLSLEILANLLGCLICDPEMGDSGDMVVDSSVMDDVIVAEIKSSLQNNSAPQSLVTILKEFGDHIRSRLSDEEANTSLEEDIRDAGSKTAACLTNCVLANLISSNDSFAIEALWGTLKANVALNDVSSCMVACAQRFETVCRHILHHDLDFVSSGMLFSENSTSEVRRDAVSLLAGAATQADEKRTMKIVLPILRVAADSYAPIGARCEVLNVLMDMFADDDDVAFQRLDVLSHFQRCLNEIEKMSSELDENDEEIVLNAHRFVEYKKKQRGLI